MAQWWTRRNMSKDRMWSRGCQYAAPPPCHAKPRECQSRFLALGHSWVQIVTWLLYDDGGGWVMLDPFLRLNLGFPFVTGCVKGRLPRMMTKGP